MKETTSAACDTLAKGMLDASDNDMESRYNVAVFLRDVAENSTKYSPEEAAEVIERFRFSQTTASRWSRVATNMGREEFLSYKGIVGATAEVTFTWSHVVALAAVGNKKMRGTLVKEWRKSEEKSQTVKEFEKKIKKLLTPATDPATPTLTPKRAFSKLAAVTKDMAEFLEEVNGVDISAPAEELPDTTKLITENIIYIWTTVPSIAAALGIDLASLGDVSPDEDDLDPEEADEEGSGDGDDQDDGTEDSEEDSTIPGDGEEYEDVEDGVEVEESKPDGAPARKAAAKTSKSKKTGTHKEPKPAAPASLEDADASAARGPKTGPKANQRRG